MPSDKKTHPQKHPQTDRDSENVEGKKGRHMVTPAPPQENDPTRGSSMQGPKQAAKGGPAGANQGGAPRGSSRLEPSHQHEKTKKDRAKR